jgi:hypothetical protein
MQEMQGEVRLGRLQLQAVDDRMSLLKPKLLREFPGKPVDLIPFGIGMLTYNGRSLGTAVQSMAEGKPDVALRDMAEALPLYLLFTAAQCYSAEALMRYLG